MNYQYKALNTDGKSVTGSLSAENPRIAARMLRQQGLNVVEMKNGIETARVPRMSRQPKKQETGCPDGHAPVMHFAGIRRIY